MLRSVAEQIVREHILPGIFSSVSREFAQYVLGSRYKRLLLDPIRNQGPTPDTLYPWNVVDYLCKEEEKSLTVLLSFNYNGTQFDYGWFN